MFYPRGSVFESFVVADTASDYEKSTVTLKFKKILPFVSIFQTVSAHTTIPKKVVIVNSRYWNRKELWVQSLMSDNALTKAVTVWLWRYDKPTLYYYAKSMLTVINCLCCLNPQLQLIG